MDNVKLILVLIVLLLEVIACSKNPEQPSESPCTTYTSAYEVEFPDGSLRKSNIETCNGTFKATDLGPKNDVIESQSLIVQVLEPKTGTPYLTIFTGQ